jgi:hypothetical protein
MPSSSGCPYGSCRGAILQRASRPANALLSAQVSPRFARLIAKKWPDSDRREAIALGAEKCSAGALPCVFAAPPGMAGGAAIRKEAFKFFS